MRLDDRAIGLSPEEGARVLALGLLAEATAAAEALEAGAGAQPLHDFRVAIRRLRSALRALRPWLAGSVRPRHEKELRRLARSTNEARDAEVQLAWLAAQAAALGSARWRAGYDLAVSRFEERMRGGPAPARATARLRLVAEKLARRLGTCERRVEAVADPGVTFGSVLAALVGEEVRALSERLQAIGDAGDERAIHRARIEGKRLRYLLEPLRGYPRADAATAVGRLKVLQDLLGGLHDAHVLAGELRDALVDAAAEQAGQLHASVYAPAGGPASRERPRASPRPGLLALVRLVRVRRDALHARLEGEWRAGGMEALAAEALAVATALANASRARLRGRHAFVTRRAARARRSR